MPSASAVSHDLKAVVCLVVGQQGEALLALLANQRAWLLKRRTRRPICRVCCCCDACMIPCMAAKRVESHAARRTSLCCPSDATGCRRL